MILKMIKNLILKICAAHVSRLFNSLMRELGVKKAVHLEKEMAIHSSILACKTPWTEEPGGLLFMGSQRVGHD